jgi:outer membrane protein, heavy metal efflux system
MFNRRRIWIMVVLVWSGCTYPVREYTDQTVCDMAAVVRDPMPPEPEMPKANNADEPLVPPVAAPGGVDPVAFQKLDRPPGPLPLEVPPGLPGSNAKFPEWKTDEEKKQALKKLYTKLSSLPDDPRPVPGPDGKPLTLSDLQRLATSYNPSIKQASAAYQAARGAALQAGAYPNPMFGYEGDTIGDAATAGFQGLFIDQLIKTGGKLKLQQAAATMDLLNAELALRKAQTDLTSQVRGNYFAVLVALENMRVNRALYTFTDNIYRVQIDLLDKGFSAPYEPMQLRPLALAARFNYLQARNQYLAGWKQLASSLGLPGMSPTVLAGRIDVEIPELEYEDVLAQVLRGHTDVRTAENDIRRAQYLLQLAQITPLSDVDVRLVVQKDFTAAPFQVVHSVTVGFTLPIWDRNKGGIIQAQGTLLQTREEPHQVRLRLTNSLVDAFNRYQTAREQVKITKQQIDDQARVYRAIFDRRNRLGDVTFSGDLVTAQQTLAGYIQNYVTAVGAQWTAVVDVANLLQTDDLFSSGKKEKLEPVFDLDSLPALPCDHPCAPIADPKWLHGANGAWPTPDQEKPKPMPGANGSSEAPAAPAESPATPAAARPVPFLRMRSPDPAPASGPALEEALEPPPIPRRLREGER